VELQEAKSGTTVAGRMLSVYARKVWARFAYPLVGLEPQG